MGTNNNKIIGYPKNGWYWYLAKEKVEFNPRKCGKWMHYFNDQEFAKSICEKAISEEVCLECKCSNLIAQGESKGVICFYCEGDDIEAHKRIIKFMIDNDLIRRTNTGKLYNNSFKFDDQTRAHEYGGDFEGKIKLEEFVNLQTGEFIV